MPKLKLSPIAESAEIVKRNIAVRCESFGCHSEQERADKIGMARGTYHTRVVKPRSWRLEELAQASVALKVPLTWLLTDHSGEITLATQAQKRLTI